VSVPAGERVLVVEGDDAYRAMLVEVLAAHGYEVCASPDAFHALETLQADPVDAVVADLDVAGMRGAGFLAEVREAFPTVPVIAITAFGTVEDAAELTRAGASDYLAKPIRTDTLLDALRRVLDSTRFARAHAADVRTGAGEKHGILGESAPMRRLLERLARVAASTAPVLITGETGTGKDLVARAIHRVSGRGPFVPVNCGAIPEHLIESELFGHARGAFTGAAEEKRGLFEAADGGTLFLDEIGELPPAVQPKLLRVLESGEVRPVGRVSARQVNVRVIAATHRDLEGAVRAGTFREDLYWRIHVLHLEVPSLRERPSDIPLLVSHFCRLSTASTERCVASDAVQALCRFPWPGNVRQLRSVLERAFIFGSGPEVRLQDLPPEVQGGTGSDPVADAAARRLTLAELERAYILETLRRARGNKKRAAELLGIPRRTLYRRLEEYGAEPGV
jgi:DNA-binding NtrC family response regulator